MWQPVRIDIQNLFSHIHSTYEFKRGKCVVIFGNNKDDKGIANNGSGKTTLFESISIALTNESLRSIKKDAFINRDADFCRIEFELDNPVLKKHLKIVRQFYRSNKPVKIEIWENDKLNAQITSVNEANKRIIDLIGVNRDDLLRYYIISQDNHYTFFTASDTEKKEIMNRITSADMIQPIITELSERLKVKTDECNDISRQVDKLSDRMEILSEQRQELLTNNSYDEEIKRKREKISETESAIEDLDKRIIDDEKELSSYDKELSKIKVEDTKELVTERKSIKKKIEDVEDNITENNTLKRKLKREVDLVVTCPHCHKEFIPDTQLDNLSPEEIREVISELESTIEKQEKLQSKLEQQLKEVRAKITKAEALQDKQNNLLDDKERCERRLRKAKEARLDCQDTIGKLNEEIRKLKKQKSENILLKNIDAQLKEVTQELTSEQYKLEPISNEIDMIKFWQFNMGKNGFSTFLANKSIKIIEGITNSYLRKFGTDMSVLINGFKILKDGSVREKIDVFVMNDGITAEQFMSKSGGERGRVTLAGILGIQHLINLSLNGKGLNFLALDEVFPGVDAMGQEKIIKVLENMGITIMLITQNVSESFNNENTLYVVKENGVSRYV